MKINIVSVDDAFKLLKELNAPVHLITHVKLVSEAAERIMERLSNLGISIDYDFIRISIVLHDTGKIIHMSEISVPGHCHEEEGEKILLKLGVNPTIARCCLSHANYNKMICSTEELIVALADKLWKGKRDEGLELILIDEASKELGRKRWDIYMDLDECFECVAAKGHERLSRSFT